MMLSDAELVRAAQRGDSTGLGLLLERYRTPLYALALRMLGHGPKAQELLRFPKCFAFLSCSLR